MHRDCRQNLGIALPGQGLRVSPRPLCHDNLLQILTRLFGAEDSQVSVMQSPWIAGRSCPLVDLLNSSSKRVRELSPDVPRISLFRTVAYLFFRLLNAVLCNGAKILSSPKPGRTTQFAKMAVQAIHFTAIQGCLFVVATSPTDGGE